jgi:hypothetical protein
MAGWYFFGGDTPQSVNTPNPEKNATNLFLLWAFILVGIAGLTTLGFSLYYIFTNPKAIRGFVIVLIVAVVLGGIAYLLSSGEQITDKVDISRGALIRIDIAIISTYILLGIAILGIIFSEVYKALQ